MVCVMEWDGIVYVKPTMTSHAHGVFQYKNFKMTSWNMQDRLSIETW